MKMWTIQRLYFPELSSSHASPHSALSNTSKLPFKCPYQFVARVASAPNKHISAVHLSNGLSLQIWGGGGQGECGLPCNRNYLMVKRKVICFSLFSFSCNDRSNLQCIYMWD